MAWDPKTVYKVGVSGPRVREIQSMVNFWRRENGMTPIQETGTYSPETAAAVKDFQSRYKSEVPRYGADGMVAGETGPILDKYARDKGYSAAPVGSVDAQNMFPTPGPMRTLNGTGSPSMDSFMSGGDEPDAPGMPDEPDNSALARALIAGDGEDYGKAPASFPGMPEPDPFSAWGETSDRAPSEVDLASRRRMPAGLMADAKEHANDRDLLAAAAQRRAAELQAIMAGSANSPMADQTLDSYLPEADQPNRFANWGPRPEDNALVRALLLKAMRQGGVQTGGF